MKEVRIDLETISKEELMEVLERHVDEGIVVHVKDMGVIDDTPAGKQLLSILAECDIE